MTPLRIVNEAIGANPLPLTRARLIQASTEIRDWSSARGWGVSIVAASLVFGVALVGSAIAGFTP